MLSQSCNHDNAVEGYVFIVGTASVGAGEGASAGDAGEGRAVSAGGHPQDVSGA